jgi:hypothetical protein
MVDRCFCLGPPADGAPRAARSIAEGSVYTAALGPIGPGAIGSTEDTPSPSASSPSGACKLAVEASIYGSSSSPLNTLTSV